MKYHTPLKRIFKKFPLEFFGLFEGPYKLYDEV